MNNYPNYMNQAANAERRNAARRANAQLFLEDEKLSAAWGIYESTVIGYEENIIRDIVGKLVKYGGISERQCNFVKNLLDGIAKRAERDAARAIEAEAADPFPVTSERIQIEGEVLSTREQESSFGTVYKMLVKATAGWKIWVTNPGGASKGDKIRFMAKVQPSRDDAKFGFGSRPTKLEVIEPAAYGPVRPEPEFCRHGNKPEDCNACYIESDFAYDAARGS